MVSYDVLHLVRRLDESYGMAIIAEQAQKAKVAVVYLQDAVFRPSETSADRFALDEDCQARGVSPDLPRLSYNELIVLVFASRRVVCW